MCHTTREVTEQWTGDVVGGTSTIHNARSSMSYTWETKQRLKATPYGFQFNLSNLSLKQKSILIALGMSRSIK
jgi:hypothetical protein